MPTADMLMVSSVARVKDLSRSIKVYGRREGSSEVLAWVGQSMFATVCLLMYLTVDQDRWNSPHTCLSWFLNSDCQWTGSKVHRLCTFCVHIAGLL